jgi:pimeloyl-ACP methyl ester carboxylesterase
MRSRPFGELRVHYREHGKGEPLLLIHGLMTTSYSWRYVYSALGSRYRIIAPDLPGADFDSLEPPPGTVGVRGWSA